MEYARFDVPSPYYRQPPRAVLWLVGDYRPGSHPTDFDGILRSLGRALAALGPSTMWGVQAAASPEPGPPSWATEAPALTTTIVSAGTRPWKARWPQFHVYAEASLVAASAAAAFWESMLSVGQRDQLGIVLPGNEAPLGRWVDVAMHLAFASASPDFNFGGWPETRQAYFDMLVHSVIEADGLLVNRIAPAINGLGLAVSGSTALVDLVQSSLRGATEADPSNVANSVSIGGYWPQ